MKRALVAAAALAVLLLPGCTPPRVAPAPMESHDVGIQLFQWPWTSIATECTDELGPAGIGWVLTSPPNEHIAGKQWWTSYQPVSYLVESKLGTRDEFAAMVSTCADAGVEIIADAVINHMTGQETPGVGVAGSSYEHYAYPGLYGPEDFHHCTVSVTGDIQDYDDAAEVQTCELVNLADLDTASPRVRETIVAYLSDLLSLGVAGFRIDAAKHMPARGCRGHRLRAARGHPHPAGGDPRRGRAHHARAVPRQRTGLRVRLRARPEVDGPVGDAESGHDLRRGVRLPSERRRDRVRRQSRHRAQWRNAVAG